jgi:hypothetical protein
MAAYMPTVPDAQQASWPLLLSAVSRSIDAWIDRYLFADGVATKYFDVDGSTDPGASPVTHLQLFGDDFYNLTALKLATRENADPAVAGDWVQLTGDGVTPPSDFFLGPPNRSYVGVDGDVNRRPYHRIELPATPPSSSTTYQASVRPRQAHAVGDDHRRTGAGQRSPTRSRTSRPRPPSACSRPQPSGFTGATGSPEDSRLERDPELHSTSTTSTCSADTSG